MQHSRSDSEPRPAACPFCGSKGIGTLAKVITDRTYWRCQACGEVWNMANLRATSKDYRYGRKG